MIYNIIIWHRLDFFHSFFVDKMVDTKRPDLGAIKIIYLLAYLLNAVIQTSVGSYNRRHRRRRRTATIRSRQQDPVDACCPLTLLMDYLAARIPTPTTVIPPPAA